MRTADRFTRRTLSIAIPTIFVLAATAIGYALPLALTGTDNGRFVADGSITVGLVAGLLIAHIAVTVGQALTPRPNRKKARRDHQKDHLRKAGRQGNASAAGQPVPTGLDSHRWRPSTLHAEMPEPVWLPRGSQQKQHRPACPRK